MNFRTLLAITALVACPAIAQAQQTALPEMPPPQDPPDTGRLYPQAPPYAARRMVVVDYHGGPIPPNSFVRSRRYDGLIVTGLTAFAVFYLCSALGEAAAGSAQAQWMYIPVVGPFLMFNEPLSVSDQITAIVDGVVQSAGVLAAIVGLVVTRQELVMYTGAAPSHDRHAVWAVVPSAPGAPIGLSVAVSHF